MPQRRLLRVQVTPTLDTSAYASGDQVSTLQSVQLMDALYTGELVMITVLDKDKQNSALDLYFFDRSVTLAADQAASSMSDADAIFCIGVVNVLTTDYDNGALNSIATVALNPFMPLIPNGKDGKIFLGIVARGAPTYAASSLVISLNVKEDDA